MDKTTLRNQLFNKYFQQEKGVLAIDFVEKLSFIPECWKKLHNLCENNIKYFDAWSTLEKVKKIEYKQREYLILKLRVFKYVIVDINKMENITKQEFEIEFNKEFFINNFDEIKNYDINGYSIFNYNGSIQELVNFYTENESILSITNELYYRLEIGEAWTYFSIDFINASAQMGFQTPNQFLYEQLFLKYDLSPSRMQDAQEKIGIERMHEMFEKIKDIKIPREVIPDDLYNEFLIHSNTKNYKLKI